MALFSMIKYSIIIEDTVICFARYSGLVRLLNWSKIIHHHQCFDKRQTESIFHIFDYKDDKKLYVAEKKVEDKDKHEGIGYLKR